MAYLEYLQNIIDTRGQWNIPENCKYWEGHHIIPVAFGGEGRYRTKHPNIIWLTLEEHKEAHELFKQDYPELVEIWKHNISKNHADVSGVNNPMYNKGYLVSGERNGRYKATVSKETRNKISISKKANKAECERAYNNIKEWRINNPEAYSKAQSRPGAKNGRAKAVICIDTNTRFECIKDAENWLKLETGKGAHISDCCKGRIKSAGGYRWKYLDI